VKANRVYRLNVRRSGAAPAFLAAPERIDCVEIVGVDSGEVELFWDTTPAATRRLAHALREDLAQLQADEFIARWRQREDIETI
jgi:hypothetical protein